MAMDDNWSCCCIAAADGNEIRTCVSNSSSNIYTLANGRRFVQHYAHDRMPFRESVEKMREGRKGECNAGGNSFSSGIFKC